eukprot:9837699-Alexandrium_andersonii.AAC.1
MPPPREEPRAPASWRRVPKSGTTPTTGPGATLDGVGAGPAGAPAARTSGPRPRARLRTHGQGQAGTPGRRRALGGEIRTEAQGPGIRVPGRGGILRAMGRANRRGRGGGAPRARTSLWSTERAT